MKISVEQLKRFKNNSSSIKTNNILPILGYLKFSKDGTVTKNAMGSFIIQKIDCKEDFLVDETILMSFVNYTSSPTIDVTIKDGKIILSDGTGAKKTSPTEPVENFPVNDTPDAEPFELDLEVLQSIGIASQFVMDKDIPDAACYVFVGNNHVCGSNGAIAYIDEFVEKLPKIVLDKNTATTISRYDSVLFSENDSYLFFETDDVKLGFIKNQYQWMDESPFATFTPEAKFEMDKREFVNFNDMVINDNISKVAVSSISVSKGKLNYESNDTGYERVAEKQIAVEGDDMEKFNFNPALMAKLLKSVPDDTLTFNRMGNRYYITGDSGFVSLIIGLA